MADRIFTCQSSASFVLFLAFFPYIEPNSPAIQLYLIELHYLFVEKSKKMRKNRLFLTPRHGTLWASRRHFTALCQNSFYILYLLR
jgi:hypothetical protein